MLIPVHYSGDDMSQYGLFNVQLSIKVVTFFFKLVSAPDIFLGNELSAKMFLQHKITVFALILSAFLATGNLAVIIYNNGELHSLLAPISESVEMLNNCYSMFYVCTHVDPVDAFSC